MACSQRYPFCFFLVTLLFLSANSQTYRNISLDSSINAGDDKSWPSPSGEFAFGFQKVNNDGFLLAIWFNRIPERTIVWSANGNSLVQQGSKVNLTSDGWLVLNDSSGKQIWTPNSVTTGASYAAMLDTGNFVLVNQDSMVLWQSFNHPTDTMLPTQSLRRGGQLKARYAETNYSNGRFKFILQEDGNLLLYTTQYPFDTANAPYWSTQTMDTGYWVIYNESGHVFLTQGSGSILNVVFSDQVSNQDFYQRVTIEYDGVFRQYAYPKSNASTSRWPVAWSTLSFQPSNICLRVGTDIFSGACGYNSYCEFENETKSCDCPPGYVFLNPNDKSMGCKQNFVPQICDGAVDESHLFEFKTMTQTDWSSSDYEQFSSVSEDWCRQNCLSDCHCAVAIYDGDKCSKKRLPLSRGVADPSLGGKALIKVRKGIGISSQTSKKSNSALILTGSLALGTSVFLNVLLLIATLVFLYRRNKQKPQKIIPDKGLPAISPRCYSYKELEVATEGFREQLGSGSFGTVYKGVTENGGFVAVKMLDKTLSEGEQRELEFKTEVSFIGGTNHKNLVKLVGFCNEGDHRLLVYEYMSSGCLADFLFGDSRPNWYRRVEIALGITRGLCYLHEDCSSQIIHCDIKPENILLDESLTARISDFGLAKLLKTDQTRTTTAIRGTKGYVAPEWFTNMPITVKVDVYSFGILLLELISCRRHLKPDLKDEIQIILADWAYDCYREGNLHKLVKDDDEEAMHDMKKVEKFVMIAIWCIQEDPCLRPTMKKVVHMLEGAVQVPIPPNPESFISCI